MEFKAGKSVITEAVTKAAGGLPNNPRDPVYAGMKITSCGDLMSFAASDGNVTFEALCPAENTDDVDITVPGKLFTEVIKTLPDKDITVTVSGKHAVIQCGANKFTIPVYPDPYPDLPVPAKLNFKFDGDQFADMLRKVLPAASRTDVNPALHAVLLSPGGVFHVAASDKYRIAVAEGGTSQDSESCLLPSWAANRFLASVAGEVELGWDDRVCCLKSGDFTIISRLISGQFPPNWRKMTESDCPVSVDTADLAGAVKLAQLAVGDGGVDLTFTNGELHITAGDDTYRSADTLPCTYTGENITILLGIKYLLDGLAGCGDTTSIGFTEPLKPVYLQSGNFRYVTQPRRRT